MELPYQPSDVECKDALCELLKTSWLKLLQDYYDIFHGPYVMDANYLATMPLDERMAYIFNPEANIARVNSLLDVVKILPVSPELKAITDEITPQVAKIKAYVDALEGQLIQELDALDNPYQSIMPDVSPLPEQFYQPSPIHCQDPLCQKLYAAWQELLQAYYTALGGPYYMTEAYLAIVSLPQAYRLITDVYIAVQKIQAILDIAALLPQRSPELEALIDEVTPQVASIDSEEDEWYGYISHSVLRITRPEEWLKGQWPTLDYLARPLIERPTRGPILGGQRVYGPFEQYIPVMAPILPLPLP